MKAFTQFRRKGGKGNLEQRDLWKCEKDMSEEREHTANAM